VKASYQVQLRIYDVLGRLVKVLVDQEQSAGSYAISWDGTDLVGTRVASGVYFYSLDSGEFKSIREMLVLQ
jgi:flagellar hook assembly protein FlgD